MDNYDTIPKELSKYNEANLNIQRLHFSWIRCGSYRSNALFDKWKWELDSIWSELVQDVNENRLQDYKDIIKTNKYLRDNIGKADIKTKLYEALNKRHNFLRILQDKVGKGGSYSDGTDNDFE